MIMIILQAIKKNGNSEKYTNMTSGCNSKFIVILK
jgi:hypothetical protein